MFQKTLSFECKNFTWKEDSFQLMEDDTNRLDVLLSASWWHGGMVLSQGMDYVGLGADGLGFESGTLKVTIFFIFGDPRNPNHRAPNQQLTVI